MDGSGRKKENRQMRVMMERKSREDAIVEYEVPKPLDCLWYSRDKMMLGRLHELSRTGKSRLTCSPWPRCATYDRRSPMRLIPYLKDALATVVRWVIISSRHWSLVVCYLSL